MVKYNYFLEREKLYKSKIWEANTDIIVANGNLQMKILELKEKMKSLEKKLSYKSQIKTDAFFRIEELTGE